MRGNISITRMVSISLILFWFAGVLHLSPHVQAEGDKVVIEKVFYQDYSGRTDVYTNKGKKCVRIRNKKTGNVWEGTTNADGVISIGESASKEDLEAEEVSYCPPGNLSARTAGLSGVVTVALETKKGQVKLTLPADIRAGDTISGTVSAYERDNPVAPRNVARTSDTLEGAVIDINGQQHKLSNRIFTFVVPTTASALPLILRDQSGRELERSQIPVTQNTPAIVLSQPGGDQPIVPTGPNNSPPTPVENFQPPRIGQVGRELSIPGNFDGTAATTNVSIGNQPAEFVAESPRSTFVKVPDNTPAQPTTLTVEEVSSLPGGTAPQTLREQFKFNPVSVDLSADKLNLVRGEGTTVRVTLRGLELDDHEELLLLELRNLTPQVVRLSGPDVMRMTIDPSKAQKGVVTLNERVTGIKPGTFSIRATVVQDPPKPNTLESPWRFKQQVKDASDFTLEHLLQDLNRRKDEDNRPRTPGEPPAPLGTHSAWLWERIQIIMAELKNRGYTFQGGSMIRPDGTAVPIR